MHLYLYTHMSIYPHTFRNRLPTVFGKVGGGTEDSDAGLENSDLSQGETVIWGLEQRRNKTKHIVGGENIIHGQEEEWTLRTRLSPPFIYLFQFLTKSWWCASRWQTCAVCWDRHRKKRVPDFPSGTRYSHVVDAL